MVRNLPEAYLYGALPEAVIGADERGLIAAVVGGVQDRLDDLRSYSRKLEYLLDPESLPDGENNVVLADLRTQQGVAFTRSLDFQYDTPADGTAALSAWAARQLNLRPEDLTNVRYGRDLLRLVDAGTLAQLAETIGAVIYETSLGSPEDAKRFVLTYFPRLRIKGTARSFEVLGRMLGFDDVLFTPLWGRLSPRDPNDIGSPVNDPDFAYDPEYWPRQALGPLYDPHVMRDGAFYTWSAVVTNGTGAVDYYPQVVNARNPYLEVSIASATLNGTDLPVIANGTATHVAAGTYALSGGAPHTKAYTDPPGSSFRFSALAEGDTWNGLQLIVEAAGTDRRLTVIDQLSAVKYRTSYFDLAVTSDIDAAADRFGTRSVSPNADLAADPVLLAATDGTAVSPFRPFTAGSITTGVLESDWLSRTLDTSHTVVSARTAASATDNQLNFDALTVSGVAVVQASEEVRPATRFLRRSTAGLLISEEAGYAAYVAEAALFLTGAGTSYTGSHAQTPLGDYFAQVAFRPDVGVEVLLGAEFGVENPQVAYYHYGTTAYTIDGTYNFANGTYALAFTSGTSTGTFVAYWTPTDTEIIRTEPGFAEKYAGDTLLQLRPEDEEGETLDEVCDEYPWIRGVVGGGELVDADTFKPEPEPVAVVTVDAGAAVYDQSHTARNVYAYFSGTGPGCFVHEPRATDATYLMGAVAIGYTGTFRDLSAYTADHHALINAYNDPEVQFLPGYSLYTVGLVQGVMVAHPEKFFGPPMRDRLVAWVPFDEHPAQAMQIREGSGLTVTHTGFAPADRVFDTDKGYCLSLPAGRQVTVAHVSDFGEEMAFSGWLKVPALAGSGTTHVVDTDQFRITLDNATGMLSCTAYEVSFEDYMPVGDYGPITGTWTFAAFRRDTAQQLVFRVNDVEIVQTTSEAFLSGCSDVVINGAAAPVQWHDMRLWNGAKSTAEMDLIRDYLPKSTMTPYPLAWVPDVDRQDRYGFRVLPNGRVVPDQLPPGVRAPAQSRVRRYDSTGSYVGASPYKRTGLAGGVMDHVGAYALGYVYPYVQSNGTVVSTGSYSDPATSDLWRGDAAVGNYTELSGGYTVNGSIAASAVRALPDEQQDYTNSVRDALWVRGDDDSIYEVTLVGDATTTELSANRYLRLRPDFEITANPIYAALLSAGTYNVPPISATLLAGNTAQITNGVVVTTVDLDLLAVQEQDTAANDRLHHLTGGLRVAATGSNAGVVYHGPVSVDLWVEAWMALRFRTVVAVDSPWDYWLDNDDTSAFGNAQSPPVAALDENGRLDFQHTGTLAAGTYVLHLETGNIGMPDAGFEGFAVEIGLNGVVRATGRLLAGRTGYNVRGWDAFELDLPASTGDWILSIQWTNAYRDALRSTARQLAVYAYRLDARVRETWRVSAPAAGIVLEDYSVLASAGTHDPATVGGWLRYFESSGSFSGATHESISEVVNESVTHVLGDVLTGATAHKFDDVYVRSTVGVLVNGDEAALVLPSFGSLVDTNI